jgi:uncharacterized protein YlxW (UPF0749 family)
MSSPRFVIAGAALETTTRTTTTASSRRSRTCLYDSNNDQFEKRKAEIQRKITELKRAGKLKRSSERGDEIMSVQTWRA